MNFNRTISSPLLLRHRFVFKSQRKVYSMSRRSMHIDLDEIPTLKQAYEEGHFSPRSLKKAAKYIPKYEHNEKFNEKLSLIQADITKLKIDAIVNAANETLLGGGGVDGAIHRAAGPELRNECWDLNGCRTGDAKITKGYELPAKHVIHTVGPIGEKPNLLQSAYKRSMQVMAENDLKSIAFSNISTGVYGYPRSKAGNVALDTMRKWLEEHEDLDKLDRIIFCVFEDENRDVYEFLFPLYFPPPNKLDTGEEEEEVKQKKLRLKAEEKGKGGSEEKEDDEDKKQESSSTHMTMTTEQKNGKEHTVKSVQQEEEKEVNKSKKQDDVIMKEKIEQENGGEHTEKSKKQLEEEKVVDESKKPGEVDVVMAEAEQENGEGHTDKSKKQEEEEKVVDENKKQDETADVVMTDAADEQENGEGHTDESKKQDEEDKVDDENKKQGETTDVVMTEATDEQENGEGHTDESKKQDEEEKVVDENKKQGETTDVAMTEATAEQENVKGHRDKKGVDKIMDKIIEQTGEKHTEKSEQRGGEEKEKKVDENTMDATTEQGKGKEHMEESEQKDKEEKEKEEDVTMRDVKTEPENGGEQQEQNEETSSEKMTTDAGISKQEVVLKSENDQEKAIVPPLPVREDESSEKIGDDKNTAINDNQHLTQSKENSDSGTHASL